jgi:hypothetical protein
MSWRMLIWNHFFKVNIADYDVSSTWVGPYPLTVNYVRAFNKPAWA